MVALVTPIKRARMALLRHIMSACCATALMACGVLPTSESGTVRDGHKGRMSVDDSFARLAILHLRAPSEQTTRRLVDHPVIDGLLARRKLFNDKEITHETFLRTLLDSGIDIEAAQRVLAYWHGREDLLVRSASESLKTLPSDTLFNGTIYLVVGSDNVPLSQDIAIDVTTGSFNASPHDVSYQVTHEAHHVGFMSSRPLPPIKDLTSSKDLLTLIHYSTQLEGMAVHSVYESRKRNGHLANDPDYGVYMESTVACHVIRDFEAILSKVSRATTLSQDQVGQILSAMSSGRRLWYQFGAIVSWELEKTQGTQMLVSSIDNPELFWHVANELLVTGCTPQPTTN